MRQVKLNACSKTSWFEHCRSGAQQTRPVRRRRLLLNTLQHLPAALRQPIKIVHEVDQQKLLAELLGECGLHPEIELASTERKFAMALVIVDDGLVVELRHNASIFIEIPRTCLRPCGLVSIPH